MTLDANLLMPLALSLMAVGLVHEARSFIYDFHTSSRLQMAVWGAIILFLGIGAAVVLLLLALYGNVTL